jgi:hypothetical protein
MLEVNEKAREVLSLHFNIPFRTFNSSRLARSCQSTSVGEQSFQTGTQELEGFRAGEGRIESSERTSVAAKLALLYS